MTQQTEQMLIGFTYVDNKPHILGVGTLAQLEQLDNELRSELKKSDRPGKFETRVATEQEIAQYNAELSQ